ncbi:MAG TPA: hypothetical protein VI731_05430, partial [Bacteroidia bacterium]|nr:hypothetical protein [Bacteroidia bacterium]
IKLDGQLIEIINNPKQSGWNRIYVPKDTVEFITLKQEQLDSIWNYVSSIIEKAPVPGHLVAAEYAESASFEIIFTKEIDRSTRTTTSNQIEFQYVESWKDLSEDTKGLYEVITKNVRLLE